MSELLFICEICGTVLNENHCKARCPNCGRTLDCSDLPALQADGKVDATSSGLHFIPKPKTGLPQQGTEQANPASEDGNLP